MKMFLALATTTIATPALAHLEGIPHVHGSDGALWGLGLVLAAGLLAVVARR